MKLKELILKTILETDLTDTEIAVLLKKKYPKYFKNILASSLRRRVGSIRVDNNIQRRERVDPKALEKTIKESLKKYPELSTIAHSAKVALKHPEYKRRSIYQIIYEIRNWT